MNFKNFLKRFTAVSILTLLGSIKLVQLLGLQADAVFILISWAVLALLTLVVVYGSLKAMDDGNFARFQGFFMGGVMGKVLLAGILFGIYAYTAVEKTSMVLIPFAVIYIPYLILETLYLAKASKEKGSTTVKAAKSRKAD